MKITTDKATGPNQAGERHQTPIIDLQPFALPSSFWTVENPLNNVVLMHAPFLFWIVEALRPGIVVTVGAGSSGAVICSSFCQAVATLGLPSRCVWFKGPDRSGEDSPSQDSDGFRKIHDASYAGFSTILAAGVEAAGSFLHGGTIDILAIDGLSSNVAPQRVVEQMRPYLSERAVVLVVGSNVPCLAAGSGEYPAWADTYSSFEFVHGEGLEIMGLGGCRPPLLEALLNAATREPDYAAVRRMFSRLGQSCLDSCQLQEARRKISWLYKVRNRLREEDERKEALINEMSSEAREVRSRLSSMSQLVLKLDQDGG